MNPTTEPTIDVAIVNWNTARDAVEAARGYLESTGVTVRVVIVDNDSEADQQDLLRRESGDRFELVESGGNLGFGHAANLALKGKTGDYVVVSNADVMPDPAALSSMVAAFESRPDTGLVGPVFRGTDNYHDDLPRPFTLLVRTMVGGYNRKTIISPPAGETLVVEQPSGACLLTSNALWKETGGFDEEFFLWYEDVDLARRLHDMGRTGLIAGGAEVEHLGGESFARLDPGRQQAIRIASLRRYLDLHHRVTAVVAKPFLWLSLKLRANGQRA